MSTTTTPLVSALLPVELSNDNQGRTKHWGSSAKRRKHIVETLISERLRRTPFPHPVEIRITRILGKGEQKWDEDSIGRGNAKEIIDSLVAVGWFRDDGPRWVTGVQYRQDATRRTEGPAVLIEVWRATGDY